MAKRQKRPILVVGKRFFSIISMRNIAKVCHWALGLPRRSSLLQPRRRSAGLWLLRGRGASRKCRLSSTTAYHSQSRVMRRAFSATDHADSGGAARWMEWVLRLCRCTHTTWQETPGVSHRAHGSRPNGPVVGDSSRVVKDLTHTSLSCGIALSARGWQSETHLAQLKSPPILSPLAENKDLVTWRLAVKPLKQCGNHANLVGQNQLSAKSTMIILIDFYYVQLEMDWIMFICNYIPNFLCYVLHYSTLTTLNGRRFKNCSLTILQQQDPIILWVSHLMIALKSNWPQEQTDPVCLSSDCLKLAAGYESNWPN